MERKYIYGFMSYCGPKALALSGVDKIPVFALNLREVSAIISDTTLGEIDPTRENVLAHTLVQDALLKSGTLLPTAFGTVTESEIAVRQLLEKNYEALERELKRLAGKIEVALKISWDEKAMNERLESGGELARIKARLAAVPSPSMTQSLLAEAGRLVESVAKEWRNKHAQRIYDHLRLLAVDARTNKQLGVKSLLNASFLVEKAKEPEFQKEVYVLDARHRGMVNFKYVAPLPPYNFVDTRIVMGA